MNDSARFKVIFSGVEIELEGSTEFVREQIALLKDTIEALGAPPKAPKIEFQSTASNGTAEEQQGTDQADSNGGSNSVPSTFGEWMHRFKGALSESDKALITARFVQSQSSSNDFKTSEVNKALRDHGIKLGNPSRELGRLATRKLMFQVRKVGKLKFMRVSVDGQEHLDTLLREG